MMPMNGTLPNIEQLIGSVSNNEDMYGVLSTNGKIVGTIGIGTDRYIYVGTTEQWLKEKDFIPKAGSFIVYSDYRTVFEDGVQKNVPSVKIGDGENSIENLAFMNSALSKLEHSLRIGKYEFDGSKDVVIPTYDGSLT